MKSDPLMTGPSPTDSMGPDGVRVTYTISRPTDKPIYGSLIVTDYVELMRGRTDILPELARVVANKVARDIERHLLGFSKTPSESYMDKIREEYLKKPSVFATDSIYSSKFWADPMFIKKDEYALEGVTYEDGK